MTINLLALIIGYLIGSVSPSYFLGRILKKVDIREVGEKNAGATNVYKTLGLWPAIIAGIFDLSKGLLSMYIAHLLGADEIMFYSAGLAAILGHVFPFYLKFRGGQGAATATGMLLYFLYLLLNRQFISLESILVLGAIVLAILVITRQKGFLAQVVMPVLFVIIIKNYFLDNLVLFTEIVIAYLFALNIYLSIKKKLFKLKNETLRQVVVWRTLLRPLGILIPIGNFYLSHSLVLWVIGLLTAAILLFDLIRLLSSKINFYFFNTTKIIFKQKEKKRLSSITLFLIANFVVILFFDKIIALAALSFLVFGDVFAKFFGLEYGKIKIWNKTFEGSFAHLVACLISAYLIWLYTGADPSALIIGLLVATLVEAIPFNVDDNLTVAISSALVMRLWEIYF